MKLKFTYTVFSLALLAFVFASNSGGRGGAANEGNSGAPGDDSKTCITCHNNNAAVQVTMSIDVLDGDGNSVVADGYEPGTTYDVVASVNVADGMPSGYGFQMVALNAAEGQNGNSVNTWSSPADNVQISSVTTGRDYAEHKGVSTSNEFRVKWTAPAEGSGTVTFYTCGNGVNTNGETGGDAAACNSLVFTEAMTSSTTQVDDVLEISIFPNPAIDVVQLQTVSPNAGNYDLVITDVLGRRVYEESFRMPQGTATSPLDVSQLGTGAYTLQLIGNGQQLARQLIVK